MKSFGKPLTAASLTIMACAAAGNIAHAQEDEEAVLGTVTVTATKQSANLQDIPVSVSALSANDLEERGLSNIEELSTLVPNLHWGEHAGTTLIAIRGVGSTVDSGITEPTVATYVDGVFLPRSTMATLRAVDLERVEVLRGPQGTLYGRNATGGAINFISAAPADSFEGEISVSAGDRSAFGVSGYLSGPLGDGISARLSGGTESQDGYVDVLPNGGELNGKESNYFRGALRFEPTSDLMIDLSVRYDENTYPNAYQQLLTPTVLPTPGQTTEVNKIFADQPFDQRMETLVAAATVDWTLSDNISLKSVTSYVDHESNVAFDADSTDLDGFDAKSFPRPSESYGQEFNLVGDFDRWNWLLGAYYFNEEASNTLNLRLGAAFAPGFGVPVDTIIAQSVASETEAYALFGELSFDVTDRLTLTGGLRYNDEEQTFLQNLQFEIPGAGAVPGGAAFATGPLPVSSGEDKVLPKLAASYAFTDNINAYVQWSKGYKSGGLNLEGGAGLATGEAGLYNPEEIESYEIGLKSVLFDGRLTANIAAFAYDYTDLQLTIVVPPTNTFAQNADADILGIEGEFRWEATDLLAFNAGFTLLDATFDDFSGFDDANPGLGVQNLDGEPIPKAPESTINLGVEYEVPINSGLFSNLIMRADGFHSDDVVLRYFGTPNETQEAYSLLNASATLNGANGNTSLRVFWNNIGDEEYLQNVTYIGAVGAFMGNYGTPSTWGVQLTQRF
ncbi:MAG: TonB-dependent receptor [Parvibaculaceae bacterium]